MVAAQGPGIDAAVAGIEHDDRLFARWVGRSRRRALRASSGALPRVCISAPARAAARKAASFCGVSDKSQLETRVWRRGATCRDLGRTGEVDHDARLAGRQLPESIGGDQAPGRRRQRRGRGRLVAMRVAPASFGRRSGQLAGRSGNSLPACPRWRGPGFPAHGSRPPRRRRWRRSAANSCPTTSWRTERARGTGVCGSA